MVQVGIDADHYDEEYVNDCVDRDDNGDVAGQAGGAVHGDRGRF